MGCNSSKDAVMPLQPSSNHNNREPLLVLPANPVEGLVNGVQQDAHHQMNNVRQRVDQGAVAVAQRVDQLKKDAVQNVEEVIDIDLNDPEVQGAATKIQAVFRGHKTRKEKTTPTANSSSTGDAEPPALAAPTLSQPSALLTQSPSTLADEQLAELEKEFDPEDTDLQHAATRIQANFRGHMARKQQGKSDDELSKELEKLDAKDAEEELDIDLTDPDLHKAATKIQASFRGHKVRKEEPTADEKKADGGQ